jgi:hypothetical protein
VGGDLVMAVVGAERCGDRLGVLPAVVDRGLLQRQQVELAEVGAVLDRAQDLAQLEPEVDVPGTEPEPGRGGAADADNASGRPGIKVAFAKT